jgi:hypothetical protein
MSPEEVRTAVEAAVHKGVFFPWWSYILAIAVSAVGAYVGAYFKRKAEDRASQENFDNLREQLRKTTQDTEAIKTTLSGKSWLMQQQWSIREKHYMDLLLNLTRLKLSLQDRDDCYMEPGSEHDDSQAESERFKELSRVGYESFRCIRELIGPASVFLSNETIEALEELVREHWHTAKFSACNAEYISSALKLVDAAYLAVLTEARNELAHTRPGT